MIWPQAAVSFLVWIGYGLWMRSKGDALRLRMARLPRRAKVLFGSLGLILSAFLLLGVLASVSLAGGVQEGSLVPWAWLTVTLAGLGFVHFQVMGAAAMISLVQEGAPQASNHQNQNGGDESE